MVMAAIVVLVSGAPADFGGSLPAVARLEFLDLCHVIFADIDPVPQDNCGCGQPLREDYYYCCCCYCCCFCGPRVGWLDWWGCSGG